MRHYRPFKATYYIIRIIYIYICRCRYVLLQKAQKAEKPYEILKSLIRAYKAFPELNNKPYRSLYSLLLGVI